MATYYINADTGSNANTGASGDQWETLDYAVQNTSTNDTIIVEEATATYAMLATAERNLADGLTIQGESVTGCIFDNGGAANYTWNTSSANGFTVKNCTFQNFIPTDSNGSFTQLNSTSVAGTITIDNCVFKDTEIDRGGGGGGGLFTSRQGGLGTYTVSNCLFYDYVKVTGASQGAICGFRDGTITFNFYNNVVYTDATGAGFPGTVLSATFGTKDLVCKNNIFYNATNAAMTLANGWGTETFENNSTYSSGSGSFSGIPTGSNNITADPLMVDPANADFRLRQSSPCIDAGVVI